MPELPEVETIARQLNLVLPGKTISSVEVLREKSARSDLSSLTGQTIKKVHRRAKMILTSFENHPSHLAIHLKMTGQLIYDVPSHQPSVVSDRLTAESHQPTAKGRIVGGHPTPDWVKTLPTSHTRAILRFKDNSTLFFNDMRVFGWLKLFDPRQFKHLTSTLPPDVVDPQFTPKYLNQILQSSRRPVKLVILDQQKIGGMGNIYANDALWLSKINPEIPANRLTLPEAKSLHQAMVEVINRGIASGGASDSTYKHINGLGGSYQNQFLTYKRDTKICLNPDCTALIHKVKLGGRGTYFCPHCQPVNKKANT